MNTHYPVRGGSSRAGTTRGARPGGYVSSDEPWHFSGVRVDALSAETSLSPISPGSEITYDAVIESQGPNHPDDPRERLGRLRDYLTLADEVQILNPRGREVFFTEPTSGTSHLVRIEPIPAPSSGTYINGNPPETRDDIHDGRWAVVTGGEENVQQREPPYFVTLDTVTIGSTDRLTTREAAERAADRSSLDV